MACPSGKEKSPKTGRCIKKCPPGKVRNVDTMRCTNDCPTGKKRNPKTGRCKKMTKSVKKVVKSAKKVVTKVKKMSPSLKKTLSRRSPSPKPSKKASKSPKSPNRSKSPSRSVFKSIIKCTSSKKSDKECDMSFIIPKTRAKTVYKNKDCVKYEKGKQMGDPSVYGTVFDTCCGGEKLAKGGLGLRKDCHNITKIVNFKKIKDKSATQYESFIDEITAQQIAYRHGIAPAIQKAYVSDENGVVIMDKMAMTFDQYVDEWVDDYIDYIQDENDSGYFDEYNHNKLVKKAVELAGVIDDFHRRLHDLGIYHRDMKGDNVMIDRNGHWKVIDFGVAAIVSDKFYANVDGHLFRDEYRMIKDSKHMFINGQPDSPEKEFYKEFVKELTRLRAIESDRLKKLNKKGVKPNLYL